MIFSAEALAEIDGAFKNASTFWKSKFCKCVCIFNEKQKKFDWSKESFIDDIVKKLNNGVSIPNREEAVSFILDQMSDDQLFKQCEKAQDKKDVSTCEHYKGAGSCNLDGSKPEEQKEFLKSQFDITNPDWCVGLVINSTSTPRLGSLYCKSLKILQNIQERNPMNYVEGIDIVIENTSQPFHKKWKNNFSKIIKEGRFQYLRAIDLALFSLSASSMIFGEDTHLFTNLSALFKQITQDNESNGFQYDPNNMIWIKKEDINLETDQGTKESSMTQSTGEVDMTQEDLDKKCSASVEEKCTEDSSVSAKGSSLKRDFSEIENNLHLISPEQKKGKIEENEKSEKTENCVKFHLTEKGKESLKKEKEVIQTRFGVPVLIHSSPLKIKTTEKIPTTTSNAIKIVGMKDCRSTIKPYGFQPRLEVLTGKPIPCEDGNVKLFVCVRPVSKNRAGKIVTGNHFSLDMRYLALMNVLISDAWNSNFKLEIGSNNEMTHNVTSCLIRTCPIRIDPSQDTCHETLRSDRDPIKHPQAYGVLTFKASTKDEYVEYVNAFVKEIGNIIHDRNFFTMFKRGVYFQEHHKGKATSEEVLQEIANFGIDEEGIYCSLAQKQSEDAHHKVKWEHILEDTYYFLRDKVHNLTVKHVKDLSLDEMIMDETIQSFIIEVMGLYQPAYEHIFFKNATRTRLLKEAKKKEKIRKKELDFQYHEITSSKAMKRMNEFVQREVSTVKGLDFEQGKKYTKGFSRKISSSMTVYTLLYMLFLACSLRGLPNIIGIQSKDPILAKNQSQFRYRICNMYDSLKNSNADPITMTKDIEDKFFDEKCAEQKLILSSLSMSALSANLTPFICHTCLGSNTYNKAVQNSKPLNCSNCINSGYTREDLLRDKMLPIWIDEEEMIRYDIPEPLKPLTLAEKLLIQKHVCLIPCFHLHKGSIGIFGHTVMFPKDFSVLCETLPRQRSDIIKICRQYQLPEQEVIKSQLFKIRKSVVLNALHWLQKNHPGYKDITIKSSNLDWMTAEEEIILDETCYSNDLEGDVIMEHETVSRTQTEVDPDSIDEYGIAYQVDPNAKPNDYSIEILKEIQSTENTKDKVPILDFPQYSDKPLDEFETINLFADAYPWLFPSGIGDISHLCTNNHNLGWSWAKILMRYHDGRFSRDPCFCFHLLNFLQRHCNNTLGAVFKKTHYTDKVPTVEDIKSQIEMEDFSYVNQVQNFGAANIRGSDGWWRHRKYELDNWIAHHLQEGHGPPSLFLTFSCAEWWWKDLKLFLIQRCKNTLDHDLALQLENGSKEEQKTARGKLLNKYCTCVQEFFQHRMDAWLETVGKDIFHLKYYYLRFEFAKGRGQIHAHVLGITDDFEFIEKFHDTYCTKHEIVNGTKIYSDYARERLYMTAKFDPKKENEPLEDDALSKSYQEIQSFHNDCCQLATQTHDHECGKFCLRYSKSACNSKKSLKKQKRYCRAGCGKETEPGNGITPGFKKQAVDTIEFDIVGKMKMLYLEREQSHMKTMSTAMLQSWRANCDVSVIVYDTDIAKICAQDIAHISGYLVSYCTKGNVTYQQERKHLLKVIEDFEPEGIDDSRDLQTLTRKLLNKLLSTRLISRPETCCELMGLDLYWCTEQFRYVQMSKARKIHFKEKSFNTNIDIYATRKNQPGISLFSFLTNIGDKAIENRKMNLEKAATQYKKNIDKLFEGSKHNEVFKKKADLITAINDYDRERIRCQVHALKEQIIHPTGMNCIPCWPVSKGYAMSTLLMYKPWSTENPLNFDRGDSFCFDKLLEEFYTFVQSEDCPHEVLLSLASVIDRHERLQTNNEPIIGDDFGTCDKDFSSEEEFCAYVTAQGHISKIPSELRNLPKGENYDFHVHHISCDPQVKDRNWLATQKKNYEKSNHKNYDDEGKAFTLSDVMSNEEQLEITLAIFSKLKEWLEFPLNHKKDSNCTFEPLLLTVRGEGGTGKSRIIKVITNILYDLFFDDVVSISAYTGNAGFNVNGKTCNSEYGIIPDHEGESLQGDRKTHILERLRRKLVLLIDERSLLSMEIIGSIEKNCSENAHGGNNTKLPFGGIPIVVLFGDDYQLPSVSKYGKNVGATSVFDKNGSLNENLKTNIARKGRDTFISLADNVKTLKQNFRIKEDQIKLKSYCQQLRDKGGLTEMQAIDLLQYHISNPDISPERREELHDKAIWIYTTNEEVREHNYRKLAQKCRGDNPLVSIPYHFVRKKEKANHFSSSKKSGFSVVMSRDCRVSITDNIWQEVGLYNGAMGTVVDIRYSKDKHPLRGDLPEYIVVSMDTYSGPIWDENNPTYVPIPTHHTTCDYNCCEIEHIPLTLSFARTIHKFQGQQVGPTHPNKFMVFNPGNTGFEGRCPGLLYTGLSRASSLGNDINSSSFYLHGHDATMDRLTDVIHSRSHRNRGNLYKAIETRNQWIHFLSKKEQRTDLSLSEERKIHVIQWIQNSYKLDTIALDRVISYHNQKRG